MGITKEELRKKLNLNVMELLNNTPNMGLFDLPSMYCPDITSIDYIALYTEPGLYHKNPNTLIGFYNYDIKFDSIKGLFNAIYYNEEKLLNKFKKRFQGCTMFISPDYSLCGDIHTIENLYRIYKARVVSIWLTMECDAIVIPNITYSNKEIFEFMLLGLEECETVAFGTKGNIDDQEERLLLMNAIEYTVDHLKKLKTIVVYSSCRHDKTIYEVFKYALDNNIKVIIPNNTLQLRNKEVKHGKV
jgi:hypothetical protein